MRRLELRIVAIFSSGETRHRSRMLHDHRGEAALAVALATVLVVVVVLVVAERAIALNVASQATGHHPAPTNVKVLSYFVFFR